MISLKNALYLFVFLCIASLSFAEGNSHTSTSDKLIVPDTTQWNFDYATEVITGSINDTSRICNACRWMIRYLNESAIHITDTSLVKRRLIQSYMILSQMCYPTDLKYFMLGLNHNSYAIRQSALNGVYFVAKSHDSTGNRMLDSLSQKAHWDDIKTKSEYFIQRLERYEQMEQNH